MPRAWLACLTIVAAFSSPLSAAGPVTVMAPVPAPVLAIARTFDLDPETDRVLFLPTFVRLGHSGPPERTAMLETLRRTEGERASDGRAPTPDASSLQGPLVVVPLDAAVWSTAVFNRPVSLDRLVMTIVTDRRAAFLAAGLATLDDQTLDYLARTPALLAELYERGGASMAAFGSSLRVRDGRVITPGEDGDRELWEALVGAPADAPDRFIRQLFALPTSSRLPYLYGTVAGLDAPHVRFALGPLDLDRATRIERFRALAAVLSSQYGEWKEAAFPYLRPMNDFVLLMMRLRVDERGRPLPPADRTFWREVWHLSASEASLTTGPAAMVEPGSSSASGATAGTIDAAWLAAATGSGNVYERGDRLDQLAFVQRVLGRASETSPTDAISVATAFPRQRMLMLTLERMGIRSASLMAFVSQRAKRLEVGDSTRGFWVMAQLQPALALVARMRMNGILDAEASESLVRSLFSVALDSGGHYMGGVARWLTRELVPHLPDATDLDTSVLLGLAGPPAGSGAPRVEWEGERYRVDFPAAELRRLQAVRGKQGGPTLALAASLEQLASTLGESTLDLDGVSATRFTLQELATAHRAELATSSTDTVPPGIAVPRRAQEIVDRVAAELGQALRVNDVRRAARQSASLHELVDVSLAHALLSTVYAADLGDPEGAALLSRNAAFRHDFGFGRLDAETRARVVWAVPRQDFQPGVAWHVTGSALGLDIALARLSLTRVNSDKLTGPPRVASLDRDGFAVGLALLDYRRLSDEMRDAIAAAVTRGTARAAAVAAGRQSMPALVDALGLEPIRQRSLTLAQAETPLRIPEMFTLTELVRLGGGTTVSDLDAWGANAMALTGCACTHTILPSRWGLLTGRPQLPLAAASVPDLNIRIASALADLRLPASLARPVLAAALQDFLEDAAPVDGGDWWALSRSARALSRERIEDYVAAAASVGGVLVPDVDSKEP